MHPNFVADQALDAPLMTMPSLPYSARSFRVATLLAIATCALSRLAAQSPAQIQKQHKSIQTNATTAIDNTTASDGTWRFAASVPSTATGTVSYTPPGGTAQKLPLDTPNGAYDTYTAFTSMAALNAAYPNGTYMLTFNGQTTAVTLTGDAYPNVPLATASAGTWTNGTLVVDPTQALTLTVNFTTNFVAGSAHSIVSVSGNTSTYSASNDSGSVLNLSQNTLTIPANTLKNGQTYTVKMDLDNLLGLNVTGVGGITIAGIYESETTFQLQAGTATSGGGTTSGSAAPAFTVQPMSITVATGSTAVLTALASGSPAPTYQWNLNKVALPGATGPRLVLSGTTSANAGLYTCTATNPSGTATSNIASLAVTAPSPATGRLINLSVLSKVQGTLTAGFVVGGTGTSGSEPLLIRASGPALTAFGIAASSILPDPSLAVVPSGATAAVATNAGWGTPASNQSAVTAADVAAGAFALTNPASHDAAVVLSLPIGGDTVQVAGSSGDSGTALAEVYDVTANYTLTSPRLINLSCLNLVSPGSSLTAGFVIGGTTAKTVLVRASGPALKAFGVAGVMPDPQINLQLASTGATLASNAGWAGDPQITAADTATGAFTLTNPASLDSAVLLTLPPGAYTAQVTSVSSAGGSALVEVYEVP